LAGAGSVIVGVVVTVVVTIGKGARPHEPRDPALMHLAW